MSTWVCAGASWEPQLSPEVCFREVWKLSLRGSHLCSQGRHVKIRLERPTLLSTTLLPKCKPPHYSNDGELPGGPEVRTLRSHCWRPGFIPGWGVEIPQAPQCSQKEKRSRSNKKQITAVTADAPWRQCRLPKEGQSSCICGDVSFSL